MELEQYPEGLNVYDYMIEIIEKEDDGSEEAEDAKRTLKILRQAMSETGVRLEAYNKIGDLVMRMSVAAMNQPGMSIDTEKMPGMGPIMDTYDRFIELHG